MLLPSQLSVESHTEIFCCIGIWDLCAIDVDWSLYNPLVKSICTDLDSLSLIRHFRKNIEEECMSFELRSKPKTSGIRIRRHLVATSVRDKFNPVNWNLDNRTTIN
jgi:hypothetical protein